MRPALGCSRPAIRRSVVVLPQPLGPSRVTSAPGSIANETSRTATTGPKALVTRSNTTAAALPPRLVMPRTPPPAGRPPPASRAARPQPHLADRELHQRDRQQHDQDQHRRVGDREPVVAVLDPAEDVGRRHVVVGADQEDNGADRGHGAHETEHQRRHDRRAQQRQDHPAHGSEAGRAKGQRCLVQAFVELAIAAMPARTPTGMLRKMKQITRITPVPVSSSGGTLNARM